MDAIRFYERQKLLERRPRSEGGFRLFHSQDIHRLEFIRGAQQLGFSLSEIRELLVLQREPDVACSHVRDLLRAKVATVRQKIRELRPLEKQLARNLLECERNLKASRTCHPGACPVLRETSAVRGR